MSLRPANVKNHLFLDSPETIIDARSSSQSPPRGTELLKARRVDTLKARIVGNPPRIRSLDRPASFQPPSAKRQGGCADSREGAFLSK
jgi:hypothetical protein